MRDYKLFLKDILDAMESIETFVEEMSQETFQSDDKTLNAVLRKFEIIGEAAKQSQKTCVKTILSCHGEKWRG